MPARHEVLYDTEAALRLVDHELDELRPAPAVLPPVSPPPAPDASPASGLSALLAGHPAEQHLLALLQQPAGAPVGLAALPFILERANAEIKAVLANLRDSREALETATVEKLHQTNSKLQEVTSATEVAATDILDALDRAQNLVDDLDAADAADDKPKGQHVRDLLREEIFGMMGALQFQDITTQQLAYAASVLTAMEDRLLQIAKLFDPSAAAAHAAAAHPTAGTSDRLTFAPDATTQNATQRQALADEIFR